MEETVAESILYGLRASSETKLHTINQHVGRDPYLMKMRRVTFLQNLKICRHWGCWHHKLSGPSDILQQMKAYKGLWAYTFFVSGSVHNLGTKRLNDDYRLFFARLSVCSYIVLCVKMLAASSSGYNVNKHATHLNYDVSPTVLYVFKVNHSQRSSETLSVCLLQIRALSCLLEIQHSLCTFRLSLLVFLVFHPLLSLKGWLWFGHSFLVTEVDRRSPALGQRK